MAKYNVGEAKVATDDFGRKLVKVIIRSPVSGNNYNLDDLTSKAESFSRDVEGFAEGIFDNLTDVPFDVNFETPEAEDIVFSFNESVSFAYVYFFPEDASEENLDILAAMISKVAM